MSICTAAGGRGRRMWKEYNDEEKGRGKCMGKKDYEEEEEGGKSRRTLTHLS